MLAERLRSIVGERWIVEGKDARLFGFDAFTAYKGEPSFVVLPGSEEEVRRVVTLLYQSKTPFVFRGSGTSLSGSSVCVCGEVMVSLSRLNRVYRVEALEIEVGAGIANALVTKHAPKNAFYAPDPSSYTVCSIGGNVCHDSGGIHVPKYGPTFNSVVKLRVLHLDGAIEEVGGTSYFNGASVFIGSEGTLGCVLRATLRLFPKPEASRTVLGAFYDLKTAALAVSKIYEAGVFPAALEMMDRTSIEVVEKSEYSAGYPKCEALLLVECDGFLPQVEEEVKRVVSLFKELGAAVFVPKNSEENSRFWRGRKGAFPAMGVISPAYLTLDAVISRESLPDVLLRIREIGEKHGVVIANVFHAADGNLHPLIPYDPERFDSLKKALIASREITKVALEHGGVLSGEHGIGIEKASLLEEFYTKEELSVMKRIKREFDPHFLLNPYKLFCEKKPSAQNEVLKLLYEVE